jgi:hypothetical protein
MRPARMSVVVALFFVASAVGRAYAAPSAISTGETDIRALQKESQPCVYCHVSGAAGMKIVYGGDAGRYLQPSSSGGAHTAATTPCLACHVSHGGPAMGGAVASKHLRVMPYQPELVDDLAGGNADAITNGTARAEGWDPRDIQITAFCTGCHILYASSATATIDVKQTADDGSVVTRSYTAHPLRTARDGSERVGLKASGERIALQPSAGCRSCHGAGGTDSLAGEASASFPHSTPGAAAFLLSAPDAASAPTGAVIAAEDGVCLRCHRWRSGNATGGVGYDW